VLHTTTVDTVVFLTQNISNAIDNQNSSANIKATKNNTASV
jgi:hypothetical protein